MSDNSLKLGSKLMPIEALRSMPIQFFLVGFIDLGTVNNEYTFTENNFANRWLVGVGTGIDMIFYHNFLISIYTGVNHTADIGLFVRFNSSF